MTIQLARRLFTVDEYDRMIETGILTKDDHVELLEGEIVEMPPIGSHHAGALDRLVALLFRGLPSDRVIIRVQSPIKLDGRSEPQPDVSLLRPREDFYSDSHPIPPDIHLLIEVADSSIQSDRQIKIPLYADAGVAEVWLVDLTNEAVTVYRSPAAGHYQEERTIRRGDRISLLAFGNISFGVEEILGPLS
jgi:Uma2 family endonuclease